MSPYEIAYAGGSVEHWNEEPGAVWIKRLLNTYSKAIWLNPEPRQRWDHTPSTKMIRQLMDNGDEVLDADEVNEMQEVCARLLAVVRSTGTAGDEGEGASS
jgi:uncharacterized protein with von Willebrand factor type A (vWA) domain